MNLFAQVIALVLGLTMHEFMHAYVGHRLGDTTAKAHGRLTLNPIAHIDPFATLLLPFALILIGSPIVFAAAKPVPFNPWQLRGGRWGAAAVAVAGPLTNLALAVVASIAFNVLPYSVTGATILGAIIMINVALFIFNLIPLPPLDGSRVLYAFVSARTREFMDRIEQGGLATIGIFVMVIYFTPVGAVLNSLILGLIRILVPSIPSY